MTINVAELAEVHRRVERLDDKRLLREAALLAAKALDRMRDRDGVDRAIEFDGMIREARRV